MSYTLDVNLALGPAHAGLTDLRAFLYDTTGANVGSAVSTGFTEIGTGVGFYIWHYTAFPDSHRGGVKFYSLAASTVILAIASINPQEVENADVKSSVVDDNVWTVATRTTTGGVVDTVNDKTGYALSTAGILAIWDQATSALTTAGKIGKLLVDNINATISSRSTLTAANVWDALTSGIVTASSIGKLLIDTLNTPISTRSAHTAADVWASVTRTITGGTVTTVSDKTGYSLSAGGVQAIWDALTSALTTVGSVGKLLVDILNTPISTRSAHTAADVWATVTRTITGGTVTTVSDKTGYSLSSGGIQAIWDAATSGLATVGSIGKLLVDNVNSAVGGVAAAVWAVGTRTITGGTVTTNSDKTGYALSSAGVQAIWDAATSALTTAGSVGKLLVDNINSTVGGVAAAVWAVATRTITGGTVTTVSDKTGYSLSAGGVQAIWDALTSALTTVGSVGKRLADNLDATISSRLASVSYTAPDNTTIGTINTKIGTPVGASVSVDIAALQADTDNIQTRIPAALVSGRIDASVGAVAANAITAASLAADASQEIRAEMDANSTKLANLDATISSRATPAQVNTEADTALADVGLTPTVTGRIDAAISSRLAAASYTAPPTAAANADAVWDEAIAGHLTAGSTGAALNAAGSAGDPWSTPLPGAYGVGTAGKIVGDNVNATIGSRATQTSVDTVDDFLDTEIAAIKAKTDNLPIDPADASDIAAALTAIDDYVDTEVATILTRIGTPVGASLSADIAGVQGDTNDLQVQIGIAGAGLTAVAPAATALSTAQWTNPRAANLDNLDAPVSGVGGGGLTQADVVTALTTYDAATGADVSAISPPTVVQIRQEMDSNSVWLSNLDVPVSSVGGGGLIPQDITDALVAYDAATGADVAAIACPPNVIGAVEFTYTVTNTATGLPLPGVECWFCTDLAGINIVWFGITDTFGIARDGNGDKPRLDPGAYFIFRRLTGFKFSPDPDQETVS